ncbi:aminotransferase class III-fold pyridoxal phosphate-dependent enzyme [Alcaligenaceae bacterium A4P071]|nr:aminotransferase class III-fold pyridoxal phosphate-dependent enzyme [Alcaligenaceae bacterium A4P071]
MKNLVGDVSSSARVLPDLAGEKLFIAKAEGPYVWDDQNRRYIDTALGFGAVLVGHSAPAVVAHATAALQSGVAPSFAHVREHGAAAALASRTGNLTKVMFTNSGSEAVHLACRAARAYTGKPVIAKLAAGFDGWFDEVSLGNVATRDALFADGHRPVNDRTTLLRFNDLADLERLFAERDDIAGVLYEPMLANAGCLLPAPDYLQALERIAHRHGALAICDEVLMGFRLHCGLTSHLWGLQPDLATVGKAIGTGVPVAAVVGRPDVIAPFEDGRASRGGTYSGNPVACAALTSTLDLLAAQDYDALVARGDDLRHFIVSTFKSCGITLSTSGYGNVFSIWPSERPPTTYDQAVGAVDQAFSTTLHLALRREGVLAMPSAFGRLYLSFAHTDDVVLDMKRAFTAAATQMMTARAGR